MAISLASLRRGVQHKPGRFAIYGTHGIGKTSLAASAPAPVFIQTEDGGGDLDITTFGLLKSYTEVMEAIGELYTQPHDFQTVVVDSLDWLEPLVWTQTAKDNGWKDLEAAGYGKGYLAASDYWRGLLDGLTALRDDKNMTVIMLAHADVKRFDSPDTEPYDRYIMKLHTRASALVQEHVDALFFANYRVSTVKTDLGFNKKAVRGVGAGDRLLFTEERPAFLAKNRYGMPDTLPLSWESVANSIPYYNTAKEAA